MLIFITDSIKYTANQIHSRSEIPSLARELKYENQIRTVLEIFKVIDQLPSTIIKILQKFSYKVFVTRH